MQPLMMRSFSLFSALAAPLISLCFGSGLGVASASPIVWNEVSDAGAYITNAQTPTGNGPLSMILGSIGPNDIDVYRIFITGGGTFSASTAGSALSDPQLFLFSEDGRGVYANDDAGPGLQAQLPSNHALTPMDPGVYYLAVSRYDMDPYSAAGLIFPSSPFGPIYGPTGPGGGDPLTSWVGSTSGGGSYQISLTGTQTAGVPEPGSLILFGGGLITLASWRRARR